MCLSAPTDSLSGGEEEEEEEDNDDDDHGDVAHSSRIEVNSSTPSLPNTMLSFFNYFLAASASVQWTHKCVSMLGTETCEASKLCKWWRWGGKGKWGHLFSAKPTSAPALQHNAL